LSEIVVYALPHGGVEDAVVTVKTLVGMPFLLLVILTILQSLPYLVKIRPCEETVDNVVILLQRVASRVIPPSTDLCFVKSFF